VSALSPEEQERWLADRLTAQNTLWSSQMAGLDPLDFELVIGRGSNHQYPAKAVAASGREAQEMLRFSPIEHVLESHLRDLDSALNRSGKRGSRNLAEQQRAIQALGQSLFDTLCVGQVRSLYQACQDQATQHGKVLRLKLNIQPPELVALPWEYIYDPGLAGFISLSRTTSLVRYLEPPKPAKFLGLTPPLRILGIVASPRDLPRIDEQRQKQDLDEATKLLQARQLVELQWLKDQTWRDLQHAIWTEKWHVLHFVGYGGFDQDAGEGFVVMVGDKGQSHRVGDAQLAWLLAGREPLPFVWLGSCLGPRTGEWAPFASTATHLVRQGIPAVVATQYELSERAARAFTRAFYGALTTTMPIEGAVTEARTAIVSEDGLAGEWGLPVLYAHSPDLCLFDRATVVAEAIQQGDESLAADDFEKAAAQYRLAAEMGADLMVQEKIKLPDEILDVLTEVHKTLSTPASGAQSQADPLLRVLQNLREVERRLPDSRAIQEALLRAQTEANLLRNRLWQDGQHLLVDRSVGRTLGRRCRRTAESVRLLAKAQELDQEESPDLARDVGKARYRLSYLENAQRTAKQARIRRLPLYAFLGVVIIGALFLLGFALDLVPLPAWLAKGVPAMIPTSSLTASPEVAHTAGLPADQTAVLMPGYTASPTTAQAATATTGPTASPEATRAAMPTPGYTSNPTPLPATTASFTATATTAPTRQSTATSTPSPTRQPTATPTPMATPSPSSTWTPTARPKQPTPARSPSPTPVANRTPSPLYSAPELIQPEDVVFLSQGTSNPSIMRWTWDGTLREDEWFDVRIWQEGMPHLGVAWTKEPEYRYDFCLKGSGYFFWSVAVIRGKGGQWLADLSPEAAPRRFASSRDDQWCVHSRR
jgi:hypothetical protein